MASCQHDGILSRLPRAPATMGDEEECLDVGALQALTYGPTVCGGQLKTPYSSKRHVRAMGLRSTSAARWLAQSYTCGRIVSSRSPGLVLQKSTEKRTGLQWGVGCRYDCFPKQRSLHALAGSSVTRCQSVWVSTEYVLVPRRSCLRITLHNPMLPSLPHLITHCSQCFIDDRQPVPTRGAASQASDDGHDDDERDETTTNLPQRRHHGEWHEPARYAGVRNTERVTNVSSCIGICVFNATNRHCEHERHGFPEVTMVGARPSVERTRMVNIIFTVGLPRATFKLPSVKRDTPNGRNARVSLLELF